MKIITRVVIALIVVGLIGWSAYLLYQKSEEKPITFKTEQPFVTNIIRKTVATGAINPRREVAIKPQVSGIVEKLYVEAGNQVKVGDLIAKIRIIPNLVNLNNAENRVNSAKISLENARTNLQRYEKLHQQKLIAEEEFLRYQTDFQLRKEELAAAEDNLQLIKAGVSKKTGTVTNTLVRATVAGMVLDVPVKEGAQVIESNTFNEGTTIATIADMSDLLFIGKIDESEVGKISEKMPLSITVGAIETIKFDGVLEYISPKGVQDQGAIQFEIKAGVKLQQGKFIRAGYSANADIILDKKDSVLAIKESLLLFEGNQVFVEKETTPQNFQKIPVKLGLSDGINIEVIEGIQPNDKLKVQEDYGKIK